MKYTGNNPMIKADWLAAGVTYLKQHDWLMIIYAGVVQISTGIFLQGLLSRPRRIKRILTNYTQMALSRDVGLRINRNKY
jgi:hypothetical protein